MDENHVPAYPPPPPAAPGLGCYAKGCLSAVVGVLLIGLAFGGFFWYVARGLAPFLSQEPAAIRGFPATDDQYAAVRAKVDPFLDAARAGQPVVIKLSADEINTLIARDPLFADVRGKVYLTITGSHLSTDTSLEIGEEMGATAAQPVYFTARAGFDASYAGGDFTMVLRQLEPLDGKPTPGLVTYLLESQGFIYSLTRATNEKFHAGLGKYPAQAEILSHVRQAIVENNHVVLSSKAVSSKVANPANPP